MNSLPNVSIVYPIRAIRKTQSGHFRLFQARPASPARLAASIAKVDGSGTAAA
jgi:hypothetical protein